MFQTWFSCNIHGTYICTTYIISWTDCVCCKQFQLLTTSCPYIIHVNGCCTHTLHVTDMNWMYKSLHQIVCNIHHVINNNYMLNTFGTSLPDDTHPSHITDKVLLVPHAYSGILIQYECVLHHSYVSMNVFFSMNVDVVNAQSTFIIWHHAFTAIILILRMWIVLS
jgi:hypothetical protein